MANSPVSEILPQEFLSRMKNMLGEDYDAFLAGFDLPRSYGLRINTAKISCAEFEALVPFSVRPVPWVPGGYFYDPDERPSRCPLYQAGLYYLQEPSAMTPAALLPIEEGDLVLDLCAAPGGKATALGAKLAGSGLLIANDISTSRARALKRNLELFGVPSVVVSDEKPAGLAGRFPLFFDKILLDAPCSGEGMFRKDESLIRDWSPEKSSALSALQKELILLASDMLSPGGMLMYSTCTFAPAEDEEVIAHLLSCRPETELLPLPQFEGFSPGFPAYGNGRPEMERCVRLFPHRIGGEGHFMALLRKKAPSQDGSPGSTDSLPGKKRSRRPEGSHDRKKTTAEKEALAAFSVFLQETGIRSVGGAPVDTGRLLLRGDRLFYLPAVRADFTGLSYLSYGLFLGECKKNRFEPSVPFALALRRSDADEAVSLPVGDPRLWQYLCGESVPLTADEAYGAKGWRLLCVEGYPLAFGKLVNGTLKNKYPAGWRQNR